VELDTLPELLELVLDTAPVEELTLPEVLVLDTAPLDEDTCPVELEVETCPVEELI
jgi:hypothetical protein